MGDEEALDTQPPASASPRGEGASGVVPEDPCFICGQDDCTCLDLRAAVMALAEGARRFGYAAARSGRIWEARRHLRSAVEFDATDARAWCVRGLCSFALGDLPEAKACWTAALNQDSHCPASFWLGALDSGPVRDALDAYNTALGNAQRGRWGQALNALQAVRRALPDFVPAGILLGLVLEGEGRLSEARSVWTDARAHAQDHPELLRMLAERTPPSRGPLAAATPRWFYPASAAAVLIVVVALFALLRPQPQSGPAETQAAAAVPQVEHPPTAPSEAGGAAPPEDVVGPASTTDRAPAVTAIQYDVAWDLFEQARDQAEDGDWIAAVPRLALVADWAAGRFYHDDALYLLARGHAYGGMTDEAKSVASMLLSSYPTSIFANSVSRNIAGTGRHP